MRWLLGIRVGRSRTRRFHERPTHTGVIQVPFGERVRELTRRRHVFRLADPPLAKEAHSRPLICRPGPLKSATDLQAFVDTTQILAASSEAHSPVG